MRCTTRSTILMCGCALAPLPACDQAAGGGEDPDGAARGAAMRLADDRPSTDSCLVRTPGGGFASVPLPAASMLSVVDLEATPTTLDLDGVVGLAPRAASRFDDLAAAVRFAPGGALEARDGTAYRADQVFAFQGGRTYPVRMVVDLPSRTYSVYVQDPGSRAVVRLARRYAFRPAQQGAASLTALSVIVDGPRGQLSICHVVGPTRSDVVYSREGAHAVVPLPRDQALVSDGVAATWKLGPAGQVLGQIARGGEVAADEAGNVYVALASGGQLALHAFTAQLAPRWSRVDPVEPSARVAALAADAAGVTVALASGAGVASIRRYPAAGGPGARLHGGGTLAALGQGGFAVATARPGGVAVQLYDLGGALRWSRAFDVPATAEVLTLGLGGRVVLGGHFSGPISFGGPRLEVAYDGEVDVNSYVVALSADRGAHVFTARIPTTRLTGAAGNAGRLVIAGETWVTPIFPHLWQLDPSGRLLPGEPETGFYEQWGRSGGVAIGASNRIYWERSMVWPDPRSTPFPYLLAIQP